jgi:hypothetical protein
VSDLQDALNQQFQVRIPLFPEIKPTKRVQREHHLITTRQKYWYDPHLSCPLFFQTFIDFVLLNLAYDRAIQNDCTRYRPDYFFQGFAKSFTWQNVQPIPKHVEALLLKNFMDPLRMLLVGMVVADKDVELVGFI